MYPHCLFISTADTYFIDFQLLTDTNNSNNISVKRANISTANSLFYVFMGIDDITEEIKSGPHKGENKYWRNVKKNVLPFYKDWEQMQNMDTSDAIFTPFDTANPNK